MSRILMVDEASLFKTLEASFLRRRGCTIVPAGSGRDLVDRARQTRPDLIVLDGDRPDLDAAACLRELKDDPALKSIPVVVIASSDRLPTCRAAGADAALGRPLPPGEAESACCDLAAIGRRSGARRATGLRARLATATGARPARVKDLSRTGLFLALRDPPAVGATVVLWMKLPAGSRGWTVEVRGIVVRRVVDDPDSHLIPGAGVRLVELGEEERRAIERYVEGPAAGGRSSEPGGPEDRGRA